MLAKGQMSVIILEDGTVRLESSDMSGVAHKAADDFFKEVTTLLGGTYEDTKIRPTHQHHHNHSQLHQKG